MSLPQPSCIFALGVLLFVSCAEKPFGATLTGRAMLLGSNDHSGVRIELDRIDRTAQTDAFGYFILRAVPPGNYTLTATHPGTIERFMTTRVRIPYADAEVRGGSDLAVVSVFLSFRASARIQGSVLNENGDPVGGARVSILAHEQGAVTDEAGSFRIDPAPAGVVQVQARAPGLAVSVIELNLAAGTQGSADFRLGPFDGPDPYRQNTSPEISALRLNSIADDSNPTVVPLVPTASVLQVRRSALYDISVRAEDPDGDSLQVFCSADRGTLRSSIATLSGTSNTYHTTWSAGVGANTIVCSALDPFGGLSTTRLVVQSAGDNLRGAVYYDGSVLFSESANKNYNIFAWTPGALVTTPVANDELNQHGIVRWGPYVVHGNTEFLFISPLTYRVMVRDMENPESIGGVYEFGQAFDNDARFLILFDLYTPLSGPYLPYRSFEPDIAPVGLGYLDLATGQAARFSTGGAELASLQSFSRRGGLNLWMDVNKSLWLRDNDEDARELLALTPKASDPLDVQLDDERGAVLLRDGQLLLVDFDTGVVERIGFNVSSFALAAGRVAYADRGPSFTSVHLRELNTAAALGDRVISDAPRYERRVWYLDGDVLIYGDQGQVGQALVRLNSELLWVYRIED